MAIDRADVCLVLIDAIDGVTESDTKIAGLAHEGGQSVVIVVNKWDSLKKRPAPWRKCARKWWQLDLSFMSYCAGFLHLGSDGQAGQKTCLSSLTMYMRRAAPAFRPAV
jgi:GTP-binding protein